MNGARRIFLYNWPMFVATWLGALTVGGFALLWQQWFVVVAAAVALVWSGVALAVSAYIYDVSPLSAGTWLTPLLSQPISTWAAIDAGLDGEVQLEPNVSGTCVGRLELVDAATMRGGSIHRARSMTARQHAGTPCKPTSLPLGSATCDVVFVVFAAHEIQQRVARQQFFGEIARTLTPNGRVMLIEHVRDAWNFAAFGHGAFHFFSRREWVTLAAGAGLDVLHEARVTPWVMALTLGRRQ